MEQFVGEDGLRKARIELGPQIWVVSELPFKKLKVVIPLLVGLMPKLLENNFDEKALDDMLSTILLSMDATVPRETLEALPIKIPQLASAVMVVAELQGLMKNAEAPPGPKEDLPVLMSGTTSTLS